MWRCDQWMSTKDCSCFSKNLHVVFGRVDYKTQWRGLQPLNGPP